MTATWSSLFRILEQTGKIPLMISIDDFAKVELKVGEILECEPIEGSEKLFKLQVDFGEEKRQVLSGIAKWYKSEDLIGKQVVFVTNLEPRQMMGLESQGMILATSTEDDVVLISPSKKVPNGSKLG